MTGGNCRGVAACPDCLQFYYTVADSTCTRLTLQDLLPRTLVFFTTPGIKKCGMHIFVDALELSQYLML